MNIASDSRSFRLLKLLPGGEGDPDIKCEIFHTSLNQKPTYEALSYDRSQETTSTPIYIHGRVRLVTADLYNALMHLRLPNRMRALWVDVLCIDHNDVLEKSHQLHLVRQIFHNAEQVAVWFGMDTPDIDAALQFCEFVAHMDRFEGMALREQHILFRKQWEACKALFFNRPWWKRQWTITEICHNKPCTIYIGRRSFSIKELYQHFVNYYKVLKAVEDADFDLSITGERIDLDFAIIMKHRATYNYPVLKSKDSSCFLPTKLHYFRGRQALDPRDHLFAHFGLCHLCDPHVIDYNVSKEALYTKYTRQFLSTSAFPLLMVESVGRSVSWNQKLPSWVPDYSCMQPCLARAMANISRNFNAASNFPPRKFVLPSEKPTKLYSSTETQLTVRGIFTATVTKVYSKTLDYPEPTAYITSQKERLPATLFDFDLAPSIQAVPEFSARLSNRDGSVDEMDTSWGPLGTEVGDIIVVVEGSRLPLVLRKHSAMDKYLFVGASVLVDFTLQSFGPGEVAALGSREEPLDDNDVSSWNDPGFSHIMFGTVCRAALDKQCSIELFLIE